MAFGGCVRAIISSERAYGVTFIRRGEVLLLGLRYWTRLEDNAATELPLRTGRPSGGHTSIVSSTWWVSLSGGPRVGLCASKTAHVFCLQG